MLDYVKLQNTAKVLHYIASNTIVLKKLDYKVLKYLSYRETFIASKLHCTEDVTKVFFWYRVDLTPSELEEYTFMSSDNELYIRGGNLIDISTFEEDLFSLSTVHSYDDLEKAYMLFYIRETLPKSRALGSFGFSNREPVQELYDIVQKIEAEV